MFEHNLALQFKGARTYIQGPDIYNDTLTWLNTVAGETKDIDFAFHRLAKKQIKVQVGNKPEGIEPVAICTFSTQGVRQRAFLSETSEDVTGRYPYPEDEIVSAMTSDVADRSGVLHGAPDYSDIEIWVAMTKALHYQVFAQIKGKWLFVRSRFPCYVRQSGAAERKLVIAASFNDKFTRSEALVNGVKVGEIYFSVV